MSLPYTIRSASSARLPGVRGGASVAMETPVIDRSSFESSLVLRCDHPATISVSVSGNPFPVVTWFVGSWRIPVDPGSEFRTSVDVASGGRTLSISRVTEELEKGIRVEAVNSVGSDQIRISVKTYKFFTGRSSSELTRSATLPVGHRYRFQSSSGDNNKSDSLEVKTVRYKSYNKFQTTQEDYDNWQKEMESRSHMRSIDDIIDNLCDDEEDSDENQEKTEQQPTNSSDNCRTAPLLPEPHKITIHSPATTDPSNSTDADNVEELKITEGEVPAKKSANPNNILKHMVALPGGGAKEVGTKPGNDKANDRYASVFGEDSVWEMFGVKLSEFCLGVLVSRKENLARGRNRNSAPVPISARIQTRSLPVERKYLGAQPPKPQTKPPIRPEVNKTAAQKPRTEQEMGKDVVKQSFGGDSNLTRSPDPGAATSVGKRPSSARPPLAPKPSFSEIKARSSSLEPPDVMAQSASLPRNPTVRSDPQTKPDNKVPLNCTPLGPVGPFPRDLENIPVEKTRTDSSNAVIPGINCQPIDNSSVVRTAKMEETHFGDFSPEHQPRQNLDPASSKYIAESIPGNPRIKPTDRLPPKSPEESLKKKPPIAKDKPLWNSGMNTTRGDGISRPLPSMSSRERLIPSSQMPTTSVRRVRSQSSGKTDELTGEISQFPGLITESTSVRQLSHYQENDHLFQEMEVVPLDGGLGRVQMSATKSEGLLTVRKRSASPSGDPDDAREGRGGGGMMWRTVMPVSRSVDVLDGRDVETIPRIGRRSLSKEWNVVTVTTKEEITILHRPTTTNNNKNNNNNNCVAWKLPLGSSRPFAV